MYNFYSLDPIKRDRPLLTWQICSDCCTIMLRMPSREVHCVKYVLFMHQLYKRDVHQFHFSSLLHTMQHREVCRHHRSTGML